MNGMRSEFISIGWGRRTRFAGLQAQRPPRGWSLQLQTCMCRFGQATEAKSLASDGLQGAGSDTKCANVGVMFL